MIPDAEARTGVEVGLSFRHDETGPGASYNKVPLCSRTIDQTPFKSQSQVGIANIKLIVAKLEGETAGKIRLQEAVVTAAVEEMRRANGDQPFEYPRPQR